VGEVAAARENMRCEHAGSPSKLAELSNQGVRWTVRTETGILLEWHNGAAHESLDPVRDLNRARGRSRVVEQRLHLEAVRRVPSRRIVSPFIFGLSKIDRPKDSEIVAVPRTVAMVGAAAALRLVRGAAARWLVTEIGARCSFVGLVPKCSNGHTPTQTWSANSMPSRGGKS